jgi:hypothetical protein
MYSAPETLCAICGHEKAKTVDHIIPRGIFANPRPDNMITVPSCSKCNHGASTQEEAFRVYLSLHVGIDTPETKALWDNHALKTLKHNKKLIRKILKNSRMVHVQTPSGIIYDRRLAGLWDSDAHDMVIERMIGGLYYHHYNASLGRKVTCRVQWLRQLNEELLKALEDFSQNTVGSGQLVYRYGRAVEDPLYSTWLFQFYGRHWASGYTERAKKPNESPVSLH